MVSTELESKNIVIKSMVCNRCIEAVEEVFNKANVPIIDIQLGKVKISKKTDHQKLLLLEQMLADRGFKLLNSEDEKIVESIKTEIINLIHYSDKISNVKKSEYLSEKLALPYYKLSKIFSKHEKISIEKYFILQKIERAKELISYGEMNVKEIAFKLGYSSLQHLSNQFKKITGKNPIEYRNSQISDRKPLDEI